MSREALAQWTQAAMDLTEIRSSFAVPLHVLMGEAVELVRFCRDYWEPATSGESIRPGLCQADRTLPASIADDLLTLEDALHAAHTEYLLTIPPVHVGLRARAEFILGELVATIEWLLDDDAQHDERSAPPSRARFDRSQYMHDIDALGVQLADYAALASQLRPRLAVLATFNISLIDDAHHLVRELRQINASPGALATTARALDLRNRIATLLFDRMNLVRNAASAVFCNHPRIARQAESGFEVRMRSFTRNQPSHIEDLVARATRAVGG